MHPLLHDFPFQFLRLQPPAPRNTKEKEEMQVHAHDDSNQFSPVFFSISLSFCYLFLLPYSIRDTRGVKSNRQTGAVAVSLCARVTAAGLPIIDSDRESVYFPFSPLLPSRPAVVKRIGFTQRPVHLTLRNARIASRIACLPENTCFRW